MNTRGQSALEYLMTYGWALVVIVIAVAALVILINPSNIQGNVCDAKLGGFTITQHAVKNTGVTLVLTNETGREAIDMDFSAAGDCTTWGTLANQTLAAGATDDFTVPCTATDIAGDYTIDVTLAYDSGQLSDLNASAECRGTLS